MEDTDCRKCFQPILQNEVRVQCCRSGCSLWIHAKCTNLNDNKLLTNVNYSCMECDIDKSNLQIKIEEKLLSLDLEKTVIPVASSKNNVKNKQAKAKKMIKAGGKTRDEDKINKTKIDELLTNDLADAETSETPSTSSKNYVKNKQSKAKIMTKTDGKISDEVKKIKIDNKLLADEETSANPDASSKNNVKNNKSKTNKTNKVGGKKKDEDKINNKKLKLAEKRERSIKAFNKKITQTKFPAGYIKYQCQLCQYETIGSVDAEKHSMKHENNLVRKPKKKPIYPCTNCDDKFDGKQAFKKHWRKDHAENECCICTVCGKDFQNKRYLSSHLQLVHMDNNSFGCKLCPKTFKRKSSLREHEKRVHEEQVFGCEQCSKRFAAKSLLKKHVSTTHEKSYLCDCCGKNWATEFHLNRHLKCKLKTRKINNIICTSCDKTFSTVDNLNKHVSTVHLKNKNFVCEICSKHFQTKFNLGRHVKIHESVEENVIFEDMFDINDYVRLSDSDPSDDDDDHNQENLALGLVNRRKSNLIVDEVTFMSDMEMDFHQSDTTDIVMSLDLAPPYKNAMHWLETGGVENLLALPGRSINSRPLFKDYQRCLYIREDTKEMCVEIVELIVENAIGKIKIVDNELKNDKLSIDGKPVDSENCEFIVMDEFVDNDVNNNLGIFKHFLTQNCDNDLLTCKICIKTFSSANYFRNHVKNMHIDIFNEFKTKDTDYELSFPHKCDSCSKNFTTKQNLLRHQNLHKIDTDNFPKCHKCDQNFLNKFLLYEHFPCKLSCKYCDFETSKPMNLERHIKKKHCKK